MATRTTEMRAINERLVIAAVRQQELAETAARGAEAALTRAELYHTLAGNFPDGLLLLFDRDLRHLLADGRGLAALGLSPEPVAGGDFWEKFGGGVRGQIEAAYRAALAGETTTLEVPLLECVYRVQTFPVLGDKGGVRAGMAVAQDVTAQRRAEESLQRRATHDALTGLPNRALLRDRLDQVLAMAARTGESAALLFLDLDDFKRVNDTLGHAAGDQLLAAVAARLTDGLRAEDTVARLGGDEFVVLLPGLRAAGDADAVARKIAARLAAPLVLEEQEMSVSVSIGVSLFPRDGRDADSLLRKADAAMYRTKEDHHVGDGPDAPPWHGANSWYE